MEKIDQQTIDLILSPKFGEDFWLFELGRAETILSDAPSIEHQFLSSFVERGELVWNKFKEKLRDFVCDREKKTVKPAFDEVILGNTRELVVAIISALAGSHNISLGIAIPLVAIALKKGLVNFCSK